MARVTDAEVKEILDTTIDTTPFITAANVLVTSALAADFDYSDDQLKEIERWLSAHFACTRDPRAAQVAVGMGVGASATFEGKTGMGLDFTRYGQTAKLLDYQGGLAALEAAQAEQARRQGRVTVAPRTERDSGGNPI